MAAITVHTPAELPGAAEALLAEAGERNIFAFYGEMGAGKTTFIKSLCAVLGVQDDITSPTYSIVNEYVGADGNVLYHFDFYRLKNLAEAYDMGYENYFYSGSICFIEWPERVEELLPEDAVRVKITVNNDGTRLITTDVL